MYTSSQKHAYGLRHLVYPLCVTRLLTTRFAGFAELNWATHVRATGKLGNVDDPRIMESVNPPRV